MKTKSTYWSVIRSLVATIVAVIGFTMVSVGQSYSIDKHNNITYVDGGTIAQCGSMVFVHVHIGSGEANQNWAYIKFKYGDDGVAITGGYTGPIARAKDWADDPDESKIKFTSSGDYYLILNTEDNSVTAQTAAWVCPPEVSDITSDGSTSITSVCLNDDVARAAIVAPSTITGAMSGDGHQGWTFVKDNVTKNTTLTLADIKNPANMAEYDGKTLYYWAENDKGKLGYSKGVTLSVCLPEVGDIASSGTRNGVGQYICLNSLSFTKPTVSGTYTTEGWEIVDNNNVTQYVSITGELESQILVDAEGVEQPLSMFYGKKIRYYAADAYGNKAYSNTVTLMSRPTVTIDLEGDENTRRWAVCDGEPISEFPSVSYSMNGTTLSTAVWYIRNKTASKYERYTTQIVSEDGDYNFIYFYLYPVGGDKTSCGGALTTDSRTYLSFKTTATEIEFRPALEDSYICSHTAPATVTDKAGNVVEGFTYWTKNNVYLDKTENNSYEFAFDCETESGDVTLGAYVKDPITGCKSTVSEVVTLTSSFKNFLYVGGTGASSDVTNPNNWAKLNDDGTTDASVHPNFSSEDCRYIINTNGVELREGELWNISGAGSKIIIGDGTWNNMSGRDFVGKGSFTVNSANAGYGVPNSYFEMMGACSNVDWITNLSNIAAADYRPYAKTFTLTGTLNTSDGIVIDVKSGSSLTINTNQGNYVLGTLAQDKVASSAPILSEGVVNGYSWAAIVPGSSVTYSGTGCDNIRSGSYSQLYIEKSSVSTTNKVVFENKASVEIKQNLKVTLSGSGSATSWYRDCVNPNESTVLFSGTVNQNIPKFNYYNLTLANASTKTVSAGIWVRNSLLVEASTILKNENATITLFGSGNNAFINKGNVICSNNSTVTYYSSQQTTIAPVYYGILNLEKGARTFSTAGVIGISNALNVGTATCTTTGSIVEFDGAGAQSIPSLEYYNLTINNSGLDGSNDYQVSLAGDVVVTNKLSLVEGILNTNGKSLTVTNTSTGAVGQGYRVSADSASYVIGDITRALTSNMPGTGSESYIFPVGTSDRYLPLSMAKITTGTDASVAVGTTNSVASTDYSSPLTSINTNAYWKIDGENYTSSSVSVNSSDGLSSCNTLGFEAVGSSYFENIVGCSVSDNSICASSIIEGDGTVALANRTINAKVYYYNCSGNASSNNSWGTNSNGTGSHPSVNFDEDDATYIFNCGATISSDLTISGSNTKVYFNIKSGEKLTINSAVTLPVVEHQQGDVTIGNNGTLTVLNSFTMADVATATAGDYSAEAVAKRSNRTKLNNHGTLNVYNSDLNITNGYIVNDGVMIFNNTDVSIASSLNQGPDYSDLNTTERHSRFINQGEIRMINCNLTVSGRQVYVKNEDGAVWLVDNTASPSKKVVFGAGNGSGVEFMDDPHDMKFIYFECGSSFVTKHADVEVLYQGDNDGCTAYLEGELAVYDGNLLVRRKGQGGGNFTIKSCGAVYMIDTDDSGDGIFMVDGTSGWQVNVEGSLYAVGILNRSDGSGNKFNVKDGAQIFVGDIGVTSSSTHSWDFSLDVKSGGTMNYCGNRTSGSDALGKNEGQLNYAGSFYQNSSPATQGDVGGNGTETILYTDGTQCMADYQETVYGNQGAILLPVELTMLYGVCKNGNVELHWQTASESNNEGFVILRSFDGVNFVEIAEVMGAGTSNETINYMYIDEDDKTGMVYYKLRQVDFDGKTKESKIVAVQTCGPNAQFAIAENEITVSFKNPEETNYVVVTSLSGKIVFSKSFKGVAEARIASPRIKGVYIISVIDSKQITSEKFIK